MMAARQGRNLQDGSALIAALFLIVVLAALGAFSVRIGADQRQGANLQLLQYRAHAAAFSGIELWTHRVTTNSSITCAALASTPLAFPGIPALENFGVTLSNCSRIASGGQVVYELTAQAASGNFGNPDFVRREVTRRVTDIGPGTWHPSPI